MMDVPSTFSLLLRHRLSSRFTICILLSTVLQAASFILPHNNHHLTTSFLTLPSRPYSTTPTRTRGTGTTKKKLLSRVNLAENDDAIASLEEDWIQRQKEFSTSTGSSKTIETIKDHIQHQTTIFNEASTFFNSNEKEEQDVPIQPILEKTVQRILNQISSINNNENDGELHILDVGCGTGALFPHYQQAASESKKQLRITALDLSPKMIELAKRNANQLLLQSNNSTNFDFVTGDFVTTLLGEECTKSTNNNEILGSTGYYSYQLPPQQQQEDNHHCGQYDAIVINACFGNFYDQVATITAAIHGLKPQTGILFITHPLGSNFVRNLHINDPDTVPHLLPSILELQNSLRYQPLEILECLDQDDYYFTSLVKVPHVDLQTMIRLRGIVSKGYGRGSRKLGFPTANLPSSLFQNALQQVPTGVYFGWVVIEDFGEKKGRNTCHKAVVNVGFSPTFDGQENPEKIVEAHLILNDKDAFDDGDGGNFYGETMRMALFGYLRPEQKFPSFNDLISAIQNDVQNAKNALDKELFVQFKADPFLTNLKTGVWIGKDGGDEAASYEFQDLDQALSEL